MLDSNQQDVNGLSRAEILKKLFISTFTLSAFTFGGGYVIITLMKKTFVDDLKWIDEDEMLDLVAIAQSSPGAMAVNGAIVIGYKLAGFLGVFVSVLATIIPPFTIISILALFYQAFRDNPWISLLLEGMQAGVAAVIASVTIGMGQQVFKTKSPLLIGTMFVAFIANYIFNVNVITIILVAGLLGLVQYFIGHNKNEVSE
ncbi:chromate transporter [Aerococcaceae bacterium WGS1372]